jgi:transglutaminase-like putative cysteine protease
MLCPTPSPGHRLPPRRHPCPYHAAEALALGEGVCQDHAHALIACARQRAIPARYVSGYLFATEDGTPHEAAHAWAELHVPGLGWVGFDPRTAPAPMPATSAWGRASMRRTQPPSAASRAAGRARRWM